MRISPDFASKIVHIWKRTLPPTVINYLLLRLSPFQCLRPPTHNYKTDDPSGLGSLWDQNSYVMVRVFSSSPHYCVSYPIWVFSNLRGITSPQVLRPQASGSTPSIKFDDLASPYNDVRSIFRRRSDHFLGASSSSINSFLNRRPSHRRSCVACCCLPIDRLRG